MNKRKYYLRIERWKDVKGYEGLYQVSNKGKIKSLGRYVKSKGDSLQYRKERLIKTELNIWGYEIVLLSKDKKQTIKMIHRLVAEAFIPNPENKPEVDHINTNKNDNCVWNLRWVTRKENQNNPTSIKNISDSKKGKKNYMFGKFGKEHPRSKSILQLDLNGNVIREWDCMLQIERELGFSHGNISLCCNNKKLTTCGYKWKYKQD